MSQQLLKIEIDYLRKELDKYINAKIYNRSTLKKNTLDQIKQLRVEYKITSFFLVGTIILLSSVTLLVLPVVIFEIRNTRIVDTVRFLLPPLINLTFIFQVLFALFFTWNFIIVTIIDIRKIRKNKKSNYYSTEIKRYNIIDDTNI